MSHQSTLAPWSIHSNASSATSPVIPWPIKRDENSICPSVTQLGNPTISPNNSIITVTTTEAPSHDNSPPQEVSHPNHKHPTYDQLLEFWREMNEHPGHDGAPVAQTCQEATTLWKSLRWFLLECAKGTGFMLIGCIATASTGLSAWTFSRLAQTLRKCDLDVDISNFGGTSYRIHVVRAAPVENRDTLLGQLKARRNRLDTSQFFSGIWTNIRLVQTVDGKQMTIFLLPEGGSPNLPLMYCPVGVMQPHLSEHLSNSFPDPGHQWGPDPETGDSKNDSSDSEWEDVLVGSEDESA